MITAIILSGGYGGRTGQAVPKQYLTVNDIPVIAYTMMNVQRVDEIDRIIVVADKGWESFIYAYAKQFGVTKLHGVIFGGETRNESIYNGLCYAKGDGETEKICLVDANRPMIPKEIFTEAISHIDSCDIVLPADPCYDSMFLSFDGERVAEHLDRSQIYKGATPECGRLDTMLELYEDETARKSTQLSTSGLAIARGKHVLLSKSHIKCFKITTVDDFELFKAFLSNEHPINLI